MCEMNTYGNYSSYGKNKSKIKIHMIEIIAGWNAKMMASGLDYGLMGENTMSTIILG